jgi:hypothetical protein
MFSLCVNYGYFSKTLQRVPLIQCRAVIFPTRAGFPIFYFREFVRPPKFAGKSPPIAGGPSLKQREDSIFLAHGSLPWLAKSKI